MSFSDDDDDDTADVCVTGYELDSLKHIDVRSSRSDECAGGSLSL